MEWIALSSLVAVFAAPRSLPVTIAGDWQVQVSAGEVVSGAEMWILENDATVDIAPAERIAVSGEELPGLPVFNPGAAPFWQGRALPGVFTQECSAAGALEPGSLHLRASQGAVEELTQGVDWQVEPFWGVVGRLEGGALAEGQPVWADYVHGLCRIDSLALDHGGQVSVIPGTPHINNPRPPELPEGSVRVANIWVPWLLPALTEDNLFPILEEAFPEPPVETVTVAERLLPKTMEKLRQGQTVKILAWGDSVTVGTYVPNWETQRWQEQFVAMLQERFPSADIQLETVAWGGRNTQSFLAEPRGSEYNYQEQVLDKKPDLIVSEFVNDAGFDSAGVEAQYGKLLADFQAIGAEWIILTPHYVRTDWMGLTSQRDIDNDPRAYVQGLREFCPKHGVALADAAARWGRLWRQGIPYMTLEMNTINHPDERGMKLFADAAMALFPAQ